jgi:DNA repair protein RadD
MLRDFQMAAKAATYAAWDEPNVYNVMLVMPTGSGKTTTFCSIIGDMQRPTVAIAHRQELVAQTSLALNREHIPHAILAPKPVIQQIVRAEHETHGHSAYHHRAETRVAGVDTLKNHDVKDRWLASVGLAINDEGHHVTKDNKWGSALALFPNARGLFPTAHAIRADGLGLGRVADGLADRLVIGPSCRNLINRGFLCDFRLLCPSSDVDFSTVHIGATGDYSLPQLRAATHASNKIVGDVIKHYLKHAAGKLGVTFAVDIEAARELVIAYKAAGVPSAVITAKTPIGERSQLMKQFRNRQLLQLVSVDCLGEGVDVPAIEVVSMVRKTASFQLYAQQFGRGLRVMAPGYDDRLHEFTDEQRLRIIADSPKPHALILDHVGNFLHFAGKGQIVDAPQEYSLMRSVSEPRGGNSEVMPYKVCYACAQPFEAYRTACPWCGTERVPAGRGSPEAVEGDLIELDGAVLAQLRGKIKRVDGIQFGPAYIQRAHLDRQQAQVGLRKAMRLWGGWREHVGETERESHKRFFLMFGVDVLSAQALGKGDAEALELRIMGHLAKHNIVEAQ